MNGYDNQAVMKLVAGELSWCSQLLERGDPNVGRATVFVSWALTSELVGLVSTLERECASRDDLGDDVVFWICDFSIRQNNASADVGRLGEMVASIGRTVAYIEPWNHPVALGRAWVLLELHFTISCNCELMVAMSDAQRRGFEAALLAGDLESVRRPINSIDLRGANAYKKRDRDAIFGLVEGLPGGFDGLNREIRAALGGWVSDQVSHCGTAAIKRVDSVGAGDGAAALQSVTRVVAAVAWRRGSVGAATDMLQLAVSKLRSRHASPADALLFATVPRTAAELEEIRATACLAVLGAIRSRAELPTTIEALLGAPIEFATDVLNSMIRFMPGTRVALQRRVDDWVRRGGEMAGGIFAVLAGPGFGKTAFVASVCASQGDAVLAVHLCRSDDGPSRDATAFVKSIAAQLALSVPAYCEALVRDAGALRGKVDDPGATALSLLRDLIVEPLCRSGGGGLIVVDGLDECERDDGTNPLLELLSGAEFARLPPGIGVLVTSRPEANVVASMASARCSVVVSHADTSDPEEARRDILRFLLTSPEVDDGMKAAAPAIADRSESLFLYVHLLRGLVASVADPKELLRDPPHGLGGLYHELFRARAIGESDFSEEERAVLATMAAAETGLHWFDELPTLSGVSSAECDAVLRRLESVVKRREDGRVRWFHKSVLDWLVRDESGGGAFRIVPGHVALWRKCTELLTEAGEEAAKGGGGSAALGYAQRYVVPHACHPAALAAMEADGEAAREDALDAILRAEPRTPALAVGVAVMAETKQGDGNYLRATVTAVAPDGSSCGVKFIGGVHAPRPSVPVGSLRLLSDGGGARLLRAAAGGGAVAVLRAVLRHGVSVCAAERGSCRGALHFAVERGRAECVLVLLEAGADVECADAGGASALALAKRGAAAAVVALVAPLPGDSDAAAELASVRGGHAGHYASLPRRSRTHPTSPAETRPCGGAGGMTELMWAARDGGGGGGGGGGLGSAAVDARAVAARSRSGWTALHFAAARGNAAAATALLAAGAAVDAAGRGGEAALWVAARSGSVEVAEVLLAAGADAAADGGAGRGTALCAAAEWGRLAAVEALLGGGALGSAAVRGGVGKGRAGATPLVLASAEGHVAVVERLLAAAAEGGGTTPLVDRRTSDGSTALLAASRAGHVAVVRALLGADGPAATEVGVVKVAGGGGHTALWLACLAGHVEVVKALLEGGANLEARVTSGIVKGATTLWAACRGGHAATVAAVLAAAKQRWSGARLRRFLDAGVTGGHLRGYNPLIAACADGSHGGNPAAVVRLLLDAGADLHAAITSWVLRGMGALHTACMHGHSQEVVEALLDAGVPADVKVTNWLFQGATPLVCTGVSGRVDLAEVLLERGADVNACATGGPLFGFTALMVASLNGHAAVVARLLDAGARVNARALDGRSAVLCAWDKGHAEVVAQLRDAGAESVGKARRRRALRMALASPFALLAAVS